MAFIKTKHDDLFQKHISTLLDDAGETITVYSRNASKTVCPWCKLDPRTDRSSGQPASGYVWSTHADYDGVGLSCPNCNNIGYTNLYTTTEIEDVIVQDISGEQYDRGKAFYFKEGSRRLYGKLSTILTDTSNVNSKTILEDAFKIVIGGNDYRVGKGGINRIGIKERFIFEVVVERTDIIEN